MIFLGTGAAQLIPAVCCDCEYCGRARRSADRRNIRGRTGFQIDEKNFIDFGPDTNYTSALFGVSWYRTENIFVTHTHPDHFSFSNFENFRRSIKPLTANLYLSESAFDGLKKYGDFILQNPLWGTDRNSKFMREHLSIHAARDYETFQAGDMEVTALPTNHPGLFSGEHCINYLFERNGKRFLYASDTGLYSEKNFEFLKGRPLDILIMECTFGTMEQARTSRHMNLAHMEEMVRRFERDGVFTGNTAFYATHFSHECGMLHEEFDAKLKELFGPNASAAYDGLEAAPF